MVKSNQKDRLRKSIARKKVIKYSNKNYQIMKKVKIILTGIALLVSTGAFAQTKTENSNRDASGRIVRGPYLTNRLFDNVFIGIAGGVNIYKGENDSYGSFGKRLAPALDVSVGKWITPCVGLRAQYTGLKAFGWTGSKTLYATRESDASGIYREKFNTMYVHGDVMWNISHAIGGYKETRTWNFVPYVGFGVARSWGNHEGINEFAPSIGLLNTIRLGKLIDLTLEARQMFVKQNFDGVTRGSRAEGMTSVTVGVTFKLNRRGFDRVPTATVADYSDYTDRISALEQELADEKERARKLANELETAQNRKPETVVETESAPMAVFFTIGKYNLSDKEMINLGYYAEIIKKSPAQKFKVSGYADKETGTAEFNKTLSEKRAQAVYDALTGKFGVNASQLTTVGNGSDIQLFDGATLNRVAIIRVNE